MKTSLWTKRTSSSTSAGATAGASESEGPSTSAGAAPPAGLQLRNPPLLQHVARALMEGAPASPASEEDTPREEGSILADAARQLLHLPVMPFMPIVQDASWLRRTLRRLHIVCSGDSTSWVGSIMHTISTAGIFLAISVMTVETLPEYRLRAVKGVVGTPEDIFSSLELLVVVIFIIEFMCRLVSYSSMTQRDLHVLDTSDTSHDKENDTGAAPVYVADSTPVPWWKHVTRTLLFTIHVSSLIDMASFVPYLIDSAGLVQSGNYTTILRVIRVTRVLQLIKFTSRSAAFRVLLRTLRASVMALVLMTAYVLMGALFFGSIMFILECGEWDESTQEWLRWDIAGTTKEPSPFQSILHGAYFGIVSMTTVGYGDLVPTSAGGRVVASMTMMAGVMCVAMPITIISSHFPREYEAFEARRKRRMSMLQSRLSILAGMKARTKGSTDSEAPYDSARAVSTSPTSMALRASARVLPAHAATSFVSVIESKGSSRDLLKGSSRDLLQSARGRAGISEAASTTRSVIAGDDITIGAQEASAAHSSNGQDRDDRSLQELCARMDAQQRTLQALTTQVQQLVRLVSALSEQRGSGAAAQAEVQLLDA